MGQRQGRMGGGGSSFMAFSFCRPRTSLAQLCLQPTFDNRREWAFSPLQEASPDSHLSGYYSETGSKLLQLPVSYKEGIPSPPPQKKDCVLYPAFTGAQSQPSQGAPGVYPDIHSVAGLLRGPLQQHRDPPPAPSNLQQHNQPKPTRTEAPLRDALLQPGIQKGRSPSPGPLGLHCLLKTQGGHFLHTRPPTRRKLEEEQADHFSPERSGLEWAIKSFYAEGR